LGKMMYHQEIGQLVAANRATITTCLSKLKRRGYLRKEVGSVCHESRYTYHGEGSSENEKEGRSSGYCRYRDSFWRCPPTITAHETALARCDMNYTIEFEPIGIRLLCEDPLTVSDAARQAGVSLKSVCGGKAVCGKCLVRIQGDGVSPVTEAEQRLLGDERLGEGWRLACRTIVSADTSVYVPATSMVEVQVIQLDGVGAHFEPRPTVQILPVTVPAPSLADQTADLQRVSAATGVSAMTSSAVAHRSASAALGFWMRWPRCAKRGSSTSENE